MIEYIRTREDMQTALQEYKYELKHYAESAYNQVIVLETNPSVTVVKKKGETAKISTIVHPLRYNKAIAQSICIGINNRIGEYSKCEIITYKQWLSRRIKQLESDLRQSDVK